MPEKQNKYNVVGEDGFHLCETTGGNYEKIRMIELRTTFFSISSKQKILEEFGLTSEELDKSQYSIHVYYEELAKVLFIEPCEAKFKDLNIAEINRAKDDFFSSLNRS